MRPFIRILIIVAVLILAGGAAAAWKLGRKKGGTETFRTAQIHRTDLTSTIQATGTVEPEELIDVGAQVAGQIQEFGKDKDGKPIDYGSVVEEGTVLAQ